MANVQQFFNMVFRPDPEKTKEENLLQIVECLGKLIENNNYRIILEFEDIKKEDISDITKFLEKIDHEYDMASLVDLSVPASVDREGRPLFGLKK